MFSIMQGFYKDLAFFTFLLIFSCNFNFKHLECNHHKKGEHNIMATKKLKECSMGELNEFAKKHSCVLWFNTTEHQFKLQVGMGDGEKRSFGMNDRIDLENYKVPTKATKKFSNNSLEMNFLKSEFGIIRSDDKLSWEMEDEGYGRTFGYFVLERGLDKKVSFTYGDDLIETRQLIKVLEGYSFKPTIADLFELK